VKYFHVPGEERKKSEEFICARNLNARQSDKRKKNKQTKFQAQATHPKRFLVEATAAKHNLEERKQGGETSRSSGKKVS
jgi:hypothetical protein